MKVVNISLDPKVLDSNSATSFRNRLYGEIVDEYRVVVHDRKDSILELTDRVTIYGVGGRHKIIRLFRIAFLLRRFVKEGKCDVIACSDPYFLSAVSYAVAKLYHVGFESHILGIEKLTAIRKAFAKFFVKRAGSIRVNSTRLGKRVSDEFGVPYERISFVPIYVPTENLGFEKATPGTKDRAVQDGYEDSFLDKYGDRFNFIFMGRLVKVKNIPMQLRAMETLIKNNPEAMLHVVGSGPDEGILKDMVSNLGLSQHVILHGRKEGLELGTYYRVSDALLLTSFAEGWPMVIFEAITAGLPVIMTDVGCAGEMIKDDENGLIVPVDDSDALVSAMDRFIGEPGLKERLAKQASDHIKNYWTREQILSGYRQSWQKAFDNRL